MSEDLIKFLILWGPTFLFILIILGGFFIGLVRGFRKSFILFIHMLVVGGICLGLYLYLINRDDLDPFLFKLINNIMSNFGTSLQQSLGVSEECESLHASLLELIIKNMDAKTLVYNVIIDDAAYIKALVELAYRLVIFILMLVVYGLLIFLLYLVYLIFYPVRRKIKKHNKKFRQGEVSTPYKKRRLLGGAIGLIRSMITGVIAFSFLGTLIYIVSGGTGNTLPDRYDSENDTTISFGDESFNQAYDYYSMICEMGDTGIFKVLNNIKDFNNTPYYFYVADMVLQGSFTDEGLDINDKFYLRDETGAYVKFAKDVIGLLVKYGGEESYKLFDGENQLGFILNVMSKEGFAEEFSEIIDSFEAKPYIINLCLASLTSVVNHIDLVTEDEKMVNLIKTLFDSEKGIKVTDLATEQDVKTLFKAVIDVVASSGDSIVDTSNVETKVLIGYAQKLIPAIENLSMFNDRQDVGNKVLGNLYTYCAENFTDGSITLPDLNDINWGEEFRLLLSAVDPLLTIMGDVYDDNQEVMIDNLLHIFDAEKENASELEACYDKFTTQISQSKLLDVVFKSSLVGEQIDNLILNMTNNAEAGIPKDIDYISDDETTGECEILLTSLKIFIKNGGAEIYSLMTSGGDLASSENISKIFSLLKSNISNEENSSTLIHEIMKSKLLHYMISTFIIYGDFGGFSIYAPEQAVDIIVEGSGEDAKTYRIVKKDEINTLVDIIVNCAELVVQLIDNYENIDFGKLFSNNVLLDGLEKSLLLKGTIANVIVNLSVEQGTIIIPYGYDDPEAWLVKGKNDKVEIDLLVEAVKSLANSKDEEGNSIINNLLSGQISSEVLLGLSESIINTLFESSVLQYTVSYMITDLGSSNFKIVVPYSALSEADALTTNPDVTVNVISSSELKMVFNEIKKIVSFEGNDIKVNYSSIFDNKEDILESMTIQATLMNLLIDLSVGEHSVVAVPVPYKEDFNEIVTQTDISGNLWLGSSSSVLDDELYLMFSALEKLITDAEGNVPEDFDIANDLDTSIKIAHDDIDTVTSSAILNSTMSNVIIQSLVVPTSVYHNEAIDKPELVDLFDCVFDILNKEVLSFNDFEGLDFDSLTFTRDSLHNVKNSVILLATVSDILTTLDSILIPTDLTISTDVIAETGEEIKANQLKSDEYDALVEALFGLYATGDTISISEIAFDEFIVTKENIVTLVASGSLRATITNKLSEVDGVSIPKKIIVDNGLTISDEAYISADENELKAFITMLIDLIGGPSESITPNHIVIDNLEITDDIDLTSSEIMRLTLSSKIKNFDSIVIPTLSMENIEVVNGSGVATFEDAIKAADLSDLLHSLIKVLGTDGKLSINLNDSSSINPDAISLKQSEIAEILESSIFNATMSDKLVSFDSVVVLASCAPLVEVYPSSNKHVIEKAELNNLFTSLFEIFDTTEIVISEVENKIGDLVITQDDIDVIFDSDILYSTISSKIVGMDGLLMANEVILVNQATINGNTDLVTKEELKAYFDAAIYINGDIHVNEEVNISDLTFTQDKVLKALESEILKDTIADKINVSELYISTEIVETKDIYKAGSHQLIIKDELEKLFAGLFALLGNEVTFAEVEAANYSKLSQVNKDIILDSAILNATISQKILALDSLTIPSNVKVLNKVYLNKTENTEIAASQTKKLFDALFITSGVENVSGVKELDFSSTFSLDSISLPDEEADVNNMFESLIVAATFSTQAMQNANDIIVLDECQGKYNFNAEDSEDVYVKVDSLGRLILALTKGLGLQKASDLKNFDVSVPSTEEAKEALVKSEIIRATISKIVLTNNDAFMASTSSEAYDLKQYHASQVLVFSEAEIKYIMEGLAVLTTGQSFDSLGFDIFSLLTMEHDQKIAVLKIIAGSVVYRSIVSSYLNETMLGVKVYQILTSSSQTFELTTGELYNYQSYHGRYVIKNPIETTGYTSFEMSTGNRLMFTAQDILALENVVAINN